MLASLQNNIGTRSSISAYLQGYTHKGLFVNKSIIFGISLGNIHVYRAKENKYVSICILITTL